MPGVWIPSGADEKSHVGCPTSILAAENADPANGISTPSASTPRERSRSCSPSSSDKKSIPKAETTSSCCHISPPTTLSDQPSYDSLSPFSAPPILLRVGGPQSPSPETQPITFFVHDKLLMASSLFFRSALSFRGDASETSSHASYSFAEAHTRTIVLPEDRPDDVRSFIQWLYCCCSSLEIFSSPTVVGAVMGARLWLTGSGCITARINDKLPRHTFHDYNTTVKLNQLANYQRERKALLSANRHSDISPLLPRRPMPPAFGPWIRLYVFADRYQVGLGLRDLLCDLVSEVAREGNCVPNAGDVELLWGSTGGDCGMRRLVVDLYLGLRTGTLLRDEDCGWNGQFVKELVEAARRDEMSEREQVTRRVREMKIEGTKRAKETRLRLPRADKARVDDSDEWFRIGRLRRRRCDYHDHHI